MSMKNTYQPYFSIRDRWKYAWHEAMGGQQEYPRCLPGMMGRTYLSLSGHPNFPWPSPILPDLPWLPQYDLTHPRPLAIVESPSPTPILPFLPTWRAPCPCHRQIYRCSCGFLYSLGVFFRSHCDLLFALYGFDDDMSDDGRDRADVNE